MFPPQSVCFPAAETLCVVDDFSNFRNFRVYVGSPMRNLFDTREMESKASEVFKLPYFHKYNHFLEIPITRLLSGKLRHA